MPNSLADLTKRENRFGHDARKFPFDVRGWGTLGLPTLAECSSPSYMSSWGTGSTPTPTAGTIGNVNMWDNSVNGTYSVAKIFPDQALNQPKPNGLRVSDDVVLTNVIGFNVKVWEPAANNGAGGYVDLGAGTTASTQGRPAAATPLNSFTFPLGPTVSRFANKGGIAESGLASSTTYPQSVYDSGCFGYANKAQPLGNSQATNGLDDSLPGTPGYGIVDDLSEYVVSGGTLAPGISPYPVPLRGIQIKIRCFEPDSRQIREVTIEHDFLPK